MSNGIWLLVQFFPLTGFVTVAKRGGFSDLAWKQAFLAGGVLAVIQMLFLLWRRKRLDRLLLGTNLYLFVGALAALLGFHSIMGLYSELQAAGIFMMIFVVGLGSAVFTRRGFAGIEARDPSDGRRASLALLAATAACGWVSFRFRGDVTLSGTVPVLALVIVSRVLGRLLTRRAAGGWLSGAQGMGSRA